MRKFNTSKKANFIRLWIIGIPVAVAIFISLVIFHNHVATRVKADNLMKGVASNKLENIKLSEQFIQSTEDFSFDLFKKSYNKDKNSLVSPVSTYLALGMTANGADGNTLKEFESLLGSKGVNIEKLNAYYNNFSNGLSKNKNCRFDIANSIWFRKDENISIKKSFLQINADYYNASVYKSDFNSSDTVKDINNWVKAKTNNKIDKIIDKIDSQAMMYLINTVYFDAMWQKTYDSSEIHKDNFKLSDGSNKSVDFMNSIEASYLKDDKAQGFIKPYQDNKYSFVALLPNEGENIDTYVSSLSGSKFTKLLNSKSDENINVSMPKFKAEYSIKLVDPLKLMGLKDCFDCKNANFSKMANNTSGNIFIGDILQKTFINVDAQGTQAGAATKVEMRDKSIGIMVIKHSITLDHPFVYAIIDNETNLPLFMGTMINPGI